MPTVRMTLELKLTDHSIDRLMDILYCFANIKIVSVQYLVMPWNRTKRHSLLTWFVPTYVLLSPLSFPDSFRKIANSTPSIHSLSLDS